MMFIGVNSLYYTVYSIILFILIAFFPGMIFQAPINFIGFTFALIVSIFLSYSIYYIMICLAFWFGEVRSIVVAYNLIMLVLAGQYIPIRLFPESIIKIMELTPFIYLVDFPVSIATGRIPIDLWMINFIYSIIWCFIIWCVGNLVYSRGIRKYEAYGS